MILILLFARNKLASIKGSRTSDHILTLKTIIDKTFKSPKKVYACFIDFKKAFDTINREALFYKLFQYNIKGPFFDIIQNMYKEVLLAVRSQNDITDFF